MLFKDLKSIHFYVKNQIWLFNLKTRFWVEKYANLMLIKKKKKSFIDKMEIWIIMNFGEKNLDLI